jgi:hypothetical protein
LLFLMKFKPPPGRSQASNTSMKNIANLLFARLARWLVSSFKSPSAVNPKHLSAHIRSQTTSNSTCLMLDCLVPCSNSHRRLC